MKQVMQKCSFCQKVAKAEERFFAGPEALICEDCVKFCSHTMTQERQAAPSPAEPVLLERSEDHEVGFQADEPFDIEERESPDLRDRGGLGGEVALFGDADDPLPGADGKEDLRGVRGE